MIVEYHRPKDIEETLSLISRTEPKTLPMGGGTVLSQPSSEIFGVVDLQDLGLDIVQDRGNFLELGATVRLQTLLETPRVQPALAKALRHEASHNRRQSATVAGTLVACNGRSPLATAFLALDASLTLLPNEEVHALGDLLPFRSELLSGRLITRVTIPVNASLAYQYVARSPADQPIVCAAVARWPSGRTRVALGGYGKAPLMAFDGTEDSGVDVAAGDAYGDAADQWASAEYRKEIAVILARRCLQALQ